MLEIKSDYGHVTVNGDGALFVVLADLIFAVRSVFRTINERTNDDIGHEVYVKFLEAFNEGEPLDWDEITKSVD